MEFHLVQNRKEKCHHDHIPFNLKGNGNIVFSVYYMETVDIFYRIAHTVNVWPQKNIILFLSITKLNVI